MDGMRFGPAGMSEIFHEAGHKSSVEAPAYLSALGLSAYEYSFGRGVRISDATAAAIASEAHKYDIAMSVHAPYFINLVVRDDERRSSNIRYFTETAHAAKMLGAKRAVFHPGARTGVSCAEAMAIALPFLSEILDSLEEAGLDGVQFFAESMGKMNQFGDLAEIIALCRVESRIRPAVDFAHLHALGQGGLKTKADFAAVLDELESGLGLDIARNLHVHFSKIEFTKMGEKTHHNFSEPEYGPDFLPLAELFYEREYTPVIICESKNCMIEDAMTMKEMVDRHR